MFTSFALILALCPIGQSFMMPASQLERMIRWRVIGNEFLQTVSVELKEDRLIMNLLDFHFEPRYYFFTTIAILFLYGQFKYNQGKEHKIMALEDPEFTPSKRFIREFLFILAIIFAKDVESVY